MNIHFAPLQGYADHLYRRFHAETYGPADFYYTPFIRIEKGEPRRQDIKHLDASKDDGTNLIPQIIFNGIEEFDLLTNVLRDRGCQRIDLNLGCPFPMQTHKGRGAALISNLETMREVDARIESIPEVAFSVKMRLGMASPDEWQALMPILNETPLSHIAMHPRIAKQMYEGTLEAEQFDVLVSESKNPVVWNGDIRTIEDIKRVQATYPSMAGIMIGRGLLARPSLAAEWREGKEWSTDRRMDALRRFHNSLFDAYREILCGDTQILQKIKPFWEYLEPEIDRKIAKAIRKASSISRYIDAVSQI